MVDNLSLFNETNAFFTESTINTLNIIGDLDLSQANISGITTNQVSEANNLYFTSGRVNTNSNVSLNTTHRDLKDNPHVVTALQIGITNINSGIIISTTERTLINTNQTNIGTNVTNISNNDTDISTNFSNISTNVTNISNLTTDINGFPDALKNLTTSEITQLENISGVTITNTQWGYLGSLDQNLITTSNVIFNLVNSRDVGVDGTKLDSITNINSGIIISSAERTLITTNQTLISNIISDLGGFPDALKNLTTSEITQLENISGVTITNTQWGYLGSLDQNLITTSNVIFNLVNSRDIGVDGTKLDSITNIGSGIIITNTERNRISTNQSWLNYVISDLNGFPDTLKYLTTSEIAQLQNIGTSTISGGQWTYLNNLDQDLITTSNVTFSNLTITLINTRNPTIDGIKLDGIEALANVTDAANVASAGALMADSTLTYNGSKIIQGDQTDSNGSTGGLQLKGTNSSLNGPHFETMVTSDDDPMVQLLSWRHDNIALSFDAYFGGSWYSSDVGSNFTIYKTGDKLNFNYNSGTAKGSLLTWNTAAYFDTSGNLVPGIDDARDLGLTGTQWKDIYFSGAIYSENAVRDKIILLWDGASSAYYGFGIRSFTLLYNVPNSSVHSFAVNGTERLNIGASAIYPETTDTYDLGSTTKTFDNLFLGDSITLPNSTKISTSASGLILQGSTGGSNSWVIVNSNSQFMPYNDNVMDLGQPGNRWDDIYATNGTIQTSDFNKKKHIQTSDLGLDFINKLKPCKYQYIGKKRPHYGLIAQEVKQILGDSDFAGYVEGQHKILVKKKINPDTGKIDPEEKDKFIKGDKYFGLRYTEFICPLIKSIQELTTQVKELRQEVNFLKKNKKNKT